MKLTKIELNDFRGFPGPQTYTFDLAGGKNLLLYGENGSGKSSLYRALVEFFNLSSDARSFGWHRNVFSSGPDQSSLSGRITIELNDGSRFDWTCFGKRPHANQSLPRETRETFTDAARRTALLEYRSLLRTNFGFVNARERLFELAVTTLLANVPIPVMGGKEKTISQLWTELLRSKPSRHSIWQISRVRAAEKAFNDGFRGSLPDVQQRTADFLQFFAGTGLELTLDLPGVQYDGTARLTRDRRFRGLELDFEVKLNGLLVAEWNDFLNEARLSALALSLYFAGAVMGNPAPPASVGIPLKLLVLDDVLIGLDLTNRLPILRILEERLADYQVLLLTYDKVWFEMAQLALVNPDRWIVYEMHSHKVNVGGFTFDAPVLKPQTDKLAEHFISLAKRHLAPPEHDFRTAALYARTSLEVKLKAYCSRFKVQVAYDLDGRHLNTDHFLQGVERRLIWDGKMPLALFKLQRIKLFRNGVLNPSAHFHPVTLAKAEVEAAIMAVDELDFPNDKTDFTRKASEWLRKPMPTAPELLESACWLRMAFELDVRKLLVRHSGKVKFRHDWTDLTLGELWDAAKEVMSGVNISLALPLIKEIEAHSRIFLNDWNYSEVSTLRKTDLEAAWNALQDSSSSLAKTRLATFT